MENSMNSVRNQWYIEIVKCCASCKFKRCDNHTRLCIAGKGIVSSGHLCDQWELDAAFDNAGRGGGKVKKKHYLYFCYQGLFSGMSIDEIRTIYEKNYGSIYEKM